MSEPRLQTGMIYGSYDALYAGPGTNLVSFLVQAPAVSQADIFLTRVGCDSIWFVGAAAPEGVYTVLFVNNTVALEPIGIPLQWRQEIPGGGTPGVPTISANSNRDWVGKLPIGRTSPGWAVCITFNTPPGAAPGDPIQVYYRFEFMY